MRRGWAGWCALLLFPAAAQLPPADFPPIREIAFEGNRTTRPEVMRREVVVRVGDAADPQRLERSRQGILDLGLFRRAGVRTEPMPDGGVRVVFTVKEKYYILPIPRIEGNSDREFGLGGQLRWNNFFGRNHTLRALAVRRDPNQVDRGKSNNYSLSYYAPLVWESPYNINLTASHNAQEITLPTIYRQVSQAHGVFVSRTYAAGPASQGLTVGGGLNWSDQTHEGAAAPAASGQATALALSADYRDVRFYVYSEEGVGYGVRTETAREGLLADYSFARTTAYWNRQWALGATPHQSLRLGLNGGAYSGGGVGRLDGAFSLGGSGELRGYSRDFVEGDAYYLATAEWLRPLGWRWLRGVLLLEAGDAAVGASRDNFGGPYASAGLGVRLRVPQFVSLEIQIGMAWPLVGGGEGRVFAGGV